MNARYAARAAVVVALFMLAAGAAWAESRPDDAAECLELVEVYTDDLSGNRKKLTGYHLANRCDEVVTVAYCIPEDIAGEDSDLRCGEKPERGGAAYFSALVPQIAPGESVAIVGDGCESVVWCSPEDAVPIVDEGEEAVVLHWGACYGRWETVAVLAHFEDEGRYTCKPRDL